MSSREPPDMQTTTSPPTTSPHDMSPPAMPIRRVAPHRRYAKKFLTLPDELLTKISDNVAPEDLPNFRLTCKILANISEKHFGEKRLAHRRFIFTEYSMKGLVELTAHPVFGPCVKSILFGTDRTTNELEVLMDALESHNITDHAEVIRVLQMYRERWTRRSKFSKSSALLHMLRDAFTNLLSHGTNVSLGVYNDLREEHRQELLLHGYGSSREYVGLPFTRLVTLTRSTLGIVQAACGLANIRPEFFELDLRGQETHDGMRNALGGLLLTNGQLQSNFDVCIREGDIDIRILSSQNRLEFKQRPVRNQMLSMPEYVRFGMSSLGGRMWQALCSASFTQLHMESCSMWSGTFVAALQDLSETLQVVKLVDVAFWGDQCCLRNMEPILHCLRHELQLTTLVLDDVRAMNKDYSDETGIPVAKGKFWHGKQQIREGLDILAGFDGCAWDGDDLDDWFESGIRGNESDLQRMDYSHYENDMTYKEFLEYKAREEERIEDQKREYEEYKATRARAEEALARVEAGDFSS